MTDKPNPEILNVADMIASSAEEFREEARRQESLGHPIVAGILRVEAVNRELALEAEREAASRGES